ncbi:MAG: 23S rRNA (adenine(2503)-C(2))-methyltransferase RlmN [Candidatus Omnitrophota bacterium]
MNKRDIKNITLNDLIKTMTLMGEKPYRAKQVFYWLYKEGIHEFSEMKNIPKALKERLDKDHYISTIDVCEHLKSKDGSEKILFKLHDGNFVETVLICAKYRETLCISTQVGCKFSCAFCASGRNAFKRNLAAAEIINQILHFSHHLKRELTNYVFMGMGEPLDNYENVSKAIAIMNDQNGMDIGARRITVSTCGIIPGIERLKELKLQINLSVSLHAVNNRLRDVLVPVNKRYPLERLIKACEDFKTKAGRMITLEYVLIKDINDSPEDAIGLSEITKQLKAKVNLIPYSEIPDLNYQTPLPEEMKKFMDRLIRRRVNVTLRESKGRDIQAACGQLAGRETRDT